MFPIENNDTFLLFFHGLDSSCETTKYTWVVYQKVCCLKFEQFLMLCKPCKTRERSTDLS